MGWWSDLWKKRSSDWTYGPLSAKQVPDGLEHSVIGDESAYLSIFLRSMRVVYVRKGLKKFFGTVHSFVSLAHLNGDAEFHVVTTPARLKDIDAANVDRVISMNHRLLGPIPYRGHDVEIELGLFSIRSADLAAPFLGVLEGMANAAGVTYINLALPFVAPLKEGINLLAGADNDSILEIGVSRTLKQPETGYFAAVRAPKGTLDLSTLKVDSDYQLIDPNGNAVVDYPYLVYAVESSAVRADWFKIPDIAAAYKAVRDAVRSGDLNRTNEAFTVFKRTTLTSADLLFADAKRVVDLVDKEVKQVLGTMQTSRRQLELPKLSKFKLYEDVEPPADEPADG